MKLLYFGLFGIIAPLAWGFLLPRELLQSKDIIMELEEIPSQIESQGQLKSDGEDLAQLEEIQYLAVLARIKNIADWIKFDDLLNEVNEKFNSLLGGNRVSKPLGLHIM